MSWEELIQQVVETSDEINTLDFRTSATAIRRQFENNVSVGNFKLRDATPQECKLFSSQAADQSVERVIEENLRAIEENFDNVPILFESAKNILQYCEEGENNKLLEALVEKHESLLTNIQDTQVILSKTQAESDACSEETNSSGPDIAALKRQVEQEQQDLDSLNQILVNYEEQKLSLDGSIEEKKKASNTMKQLAKDLEELTIEENNDLELIERLKLELQQKQQQLEQLEEEEEAMKSNKTSKRSVLGDMLETQFDELQKMVKASMSSNGGENVEASMGETLETLTGLIGQCENAEINKMTADVLNDIQDKLIFLMANFQPQDQELICSMPATAQTQTAAKVLRTIKENRGEISVNLLKEQVAAEGIPQGQVLQCIYMLVANSLIEIDRTKKENPVRLR
ncbi:hypothetical protein K493DRAFT_13662 [Basidiobolus meristosporus CBS 931.73]|uniref:Uncharacterized protein n=1 Tax=Basidiobolus meristosporus CBS 931.73 TaxID=1314790 RepID=A0A1Y1YI96_9FUNG|nr:hypothetical protein K493DRAFT_13662 [Basidiobolus meristosporus CBS 931.73]|eukprot:ORX97593.1 hypothetical protein K493DRAFT_13662 [Basidiobolus meristosporus CBS 931.73]